MAQVNEQSVANSVLRPVAGAAFWAAIALPFLHLPLLVTGLDSQTKLTAFVALLLINLLAVALGQLHATSSSE